MMSKQPSNRESIYAIHANNFPQDPPTDTARLPAAVGNSENKFDFNNASYMDLHSNYLLPADRGRVVEPTGWPVADLPRMPEPMPRAFDVEKFDTLSESEDVKRTNRTRLGPRFHRWAAGGGNNETVDEDDWDDEEPPPYTEAGPSEPTMGSHAEEWEDAKNKEDWASDVADQFTQSNPSNEPRKSGFFRKLLVIV
jgi:hypothetical protein